MIPPRVNAMSRVDTTRGNAMSRLVEIQNTTGNFGGILHVKYCVATRVSTCIKMKL